MELGARRLPAMNVTYKGSEYLVMFDPPLVMDVSPYINLRVRNKRLYRLLMVLALAQSTMTWFVSLVKREN